MGRNLIETIMGAVVLLVAGFFLVFAYAHANVGGVKGYTVKAQFTNVGGLESGADVRINGIKVGDVTGLTLDPQTFNAVVSMTIRPGVHLPTDTVASVASDGLLGGKFVQLQPGSATTMIAANGMLTHTVTYKSIEQMVGDLIFLATADNAPPKAAAPTEPTAPANPGAIAPSLGGPIK